MEYITKLAKPKISIWGLALGYFAFYIPYSALAKVLSEGLLPGMNGPVSGFQLLPVVLMGTIAAFAIFMVVSGWWRYAGKLRIGRFSIPFATDRYTFYSGIAAAVIIATTTLAYTFSGISIVFALLLMRGGVLIIAPLVDKTFHRRVHWYSWAALAMSLLALGLAFADQNGYQLSLAVIVNIAAYLSGYVFRLRFMTRHAKLEDQELTYRYFTEEMIVAAWVLAIVPALLAMLGIGDAMLQLREGFLTVFSSSLTVPELLIGAFYACLYFFGTSIYLDSRENTFCIPINRCSSLLSGVCASFILSYILGMNMVNTTQLVSAGIIILALLTLSYPVFANESFGRGSLQQLFIFVCSGNTSRSPIAQAICTAEIASRLGVLNEQLAHLPIKITSAGLSAESGAPLHPYAATVLKEMNVPVPAHSASNLTEEQVKNARIIWCMSQQQKEEILQRFPVAKGKINLLNPAAEIENPAGKSLEVMRNVALQIQELLRIQLREEERLLNGFKMALAR